MEAFFNQAYVDDTAPWDIGRPQPEIVALANAGEIAGRVLDAGCGTGEQALFLASRGHVVLGIDGAEAAIARARQKARDRRLPARVVVWDALDLARLGETFDTVVDVGLFHVFDDDERRRYVAGLREVTVDGGHVVVMCFSEREPGDSGPRRVTRRELRDAFAEGWRVEWIRPASFESRRGDGRAAAWLAKIARHAATSRRGGPHG